MKCWDIQILKKYTHTHRRNVNRQRADEQLERLKDQLTLQQFLQECDEVSVFLSDSFLTGYFFF